MGRGGEEGGDGERWREGRGDQPEDENTTLEYKG